MLEGKTETKYAVARRNSIISDGYDDVATAQQQLAHIEDTMRSVGLKPDVHVVVVDVETSVGRPHAYVEPKPDEENGDEPEDIEPGHLNARATGKDITEAGAKLAEKTATSD